MDKIEALARRIDPEAFDQVDRMRDYPAMTTKDGARLDAMLSRTQKARDAARIAIGVSLILNQMDDGK